MNRIIYISAGILCLMFIIIFPQSPRYLEKNITFALVGDVMLGTNYPDSNRLPPEPQKLFSGAKNFLSTADIAICNLEGAITDHNSCRKKQSEGRVYAFRMPIEYAQVLADAGFDVVSTANNHSRDFFSQGRFDTERILDSLGIGHTGRIGDIATVEVSGKEIAVIGFCTSPESYSLLDIPQACRIVDSLDSIFDIVVVTFHGGAEGKQFCHIPDTMEKFLGEKRGELKKFARGVVDAGADIVFGHGPHIPRAIEIYNGKIIAYSLGNFCTWWGINVAGITGYAPLLWVELNPQGELVTFDIISFEQHSEHYPVLDYENKAKEFILKLSESDFGLNPLSILKTDTTIADDYEDISTKE
ncbi:CapA family protein [bacterium]|nr:MAG: CapA family protein [bacterium]